MPYPINQSWREQIELNWIELNWIGARDGLWDTALKFLSPGPRNDVTDHLEGSQAKKSGHFGGSLGFYWYWRMSTLIKYSSFFLVSSVSQNNGN